MKKALLCIAMITLFLVFNAKPAGAIVDPKSSLNNRFGIHIISEGDLEDAASLVNSSGGNWGYVTLVIRKDERKIDKWQKVFDQMRRLHLIPIVRIATTQKDDLWEKPQLNDIKNWVYFLNSLNWVVTNRYVIIGNEPNHAKEWADDVSPNEYADYLVSFSKQLKASSENFYVLPAALDASAPNDKQHMEESLFIRKMYEHNSSVFNHIDAWNSHSYPNPNFSGSEEDVGKGSIKTYEWEIGYLKSLGVTKELDIFITETGWAQYVNGSKEGYKNEESVTKSIVYAFNNVWTNDNIIAVTPFILNYSEPPFDVFSWKDKNGQYYQFFNEVQEIQKTAGQPNQITSGEIIAVLTPKIIKQKDKFSGIAYVKNTGQTIWKKGEVVIFSEKYSDLEFEPFLFDNIEPGHRGFIFFRGDISSLVLEDVYQSPLKLKRVDESFGNSYRLQIEKESLPKINEVTMSSRFKMFIVKVLTHIFR